MSTYHKLQVEFVINHGADNYTTKLEMTDAQYTSFKQQSSSSMRKRRGRPSKKSTPNQQKRSQSDDEADSPDKDINSDTRQQFKEYNAQIRKEVKNAGFDNSKAVFHEREEDASDEDELDEKSDDEFIDQLKKKQEDKESINLDRLTKRQRMNHIAKNNLGQRG